jgi:hypothetical protein
MDEPLDEAYFKWLYRQVASVRLKNPARTYWSLTRHLFKKEFIWLVPNDDNRVEDGRDLRYEFIEENKLEPDLDWLGVGCSMFEMMIGLSRRLAFESEGESAEWFWHLLKNLDLRHHSDANYDDHNKIQFDVVDDILDQVIWRTYKPDGTGGLFPLFNTHEDQRDIELWYQMSRYLLEHYGIK